MIQDVKLGTHSYMYAISKCAFLLGFRLENKFCFFRRQSSKSQIMWVGKGCGHNKGSNGVAYDDSYCDKF